MFTTVTTCQCLQSLHRTFVLVFFLRRLGRRKPFSLAPWVYLKRFSLFMFYPTVTSVRVSGVLTMIHEVYVGEDCDCLDAESWYPGVPLKDVIVFECSSMSPIKGEIRRRANISFKTVIRRNYIIRKSGLNYLLLVLSKELGAHSFQSVMKDIVHSILVLETDEFRHYYQITGANHFRDSIVKLVI